MEMLGAIIIGELSRSSACATASACAALPSSIGISCGSTSIISSAILAASMETMASYQRCGTSSSCDMLPTSMMWRWIHVTT